MANKNTNPVPALTIEERRAALAKAMDMRKKRAEVLQDLRDGKIKMAAVLNSDDEAVRGIRVYQLIRTCKGIGERKAYKVLDDLGISYTRRIQGLGRCQKEALNAFAASRGI